MGINFRVPHGQGIRLSERCRNRDEFADSLKKRDFGALGRHLMACPACRKVAVDSLKALSSEGIVFQQSKKVSTAEEGAVANASTEVESINIFISKGKIDSVSVEGFERFARGAGVRWNIENPVKIVLEIESFEGKFVLRAKGTGAGIALRRRGVRPQEEARPLEGTLFWPAMEVGIFSLIIVSSAGEKAFLMKVAEI